MEMGASQCLRLLVLHCCGAKQKNCSDQVSPGETGKLYPLGEFMDGELSRKKNKIKRFRKQNKHHQNWEEELRKGYP